MEEIWKPIPGFEGLYDASSLGRIRSTPGKITSSAHAEKRVWKTRIMKPKIQKSAYGKPARGDYRVSLWKDGKPSDHLVARLVAIAWIGPPEDGMTVNHKNGNFRDNRPENLEWLSIGDNVRHGFRTGLFDANMKPVNLKDPSGKIISFRSFSDASRMLGHNVGYISCRLQHGYNTAKSINGTVYAIL